MRKGREQSAAASVFGTRSRFLTKRKKLVLCIMMLLLMEGWEKYRQKDSQPDRGSFSHFSAALPVVRPRSDHELLKARRKAPHVEDGHPYKDAQPGVPQKSLIRGAAGRSLHLACQISALADASPACVVHMPTTHQNLGFRV